MSVKMCMKGARAMKQSSRIHLHSNEEERAGPLFPAPPLSSRAGVHISRVRITCLNNRRHRVVLSCKLCKTRPQHAFFISIPIDLLGVIRDEPGKSGALASIRVNGRRAGSRRQMVVAFDTSPNDRPQSVSCP